jgi:hypothetical protein
MSNMYSYLSYDVIGFRKGVEDTSPDSSFVEKDLSR